MSEIASTPMERLFAGIALVLLSVPFFCFASGEAIYVALFVIGMSVYFGLGALATVAGVLWTSPVRSERRRVAIPVAVLLPLTFLLLVAPWLRRAPNLDTELYPLVIASALWLVLPLRRAYWLIALPAGVMTTMTVVTILHFDAKDILASGAFAIGLACTFALLYPLSDPERRQTWVLIPAAVLLVIGVVTLLLSNPVVGYIWPPVLMLGGSALVVQGALESRTGNQTAEAGSDIQKEEK